MLSELVSSIRFWWCGSQVVNVLIVSLKTGFASHLCNEDILKYSRFMKRLRSTFEFKRFLCLPFL